MGFTVSGRSSRQTVSTGHADAESAVARAQELIDRREFYDIYIIGAAGERYDAPYFDEFLQRYQRPDLDQGPVPKNGPLTQIT